MRGAEATAGGNGLPLRTPAPRTAHAPRDIYGTLLGVPVALALGLAYVRRRP